MATQKEIFSLRAFELSYKRASSGVELYLSSFQVFQFFQFPRLQVFCIILL